MKKQGLLIAVGLICIGILGYVCLSDVSDIPAAGIGTGEEKPSEEEVWSLPVTFTGGGVFQQYEQQAYEKLQTMSLEEKVGQLLLGRCSEETAITDLQTYHLGGFILFKKNFSDKSAEEVKATLANYQNASKIPLVLSTDEEGGAVVRISDNKSLASKPFLSPQRLYSKGGLQLIEQDAANKAALLKSLGINVNFAPVADVSVNKKDYIYPRSFGKSAEETAEYVKTVVTASQAGGLGAVLKHFPGYGNNVDTHKGASVDGRPYTQFETVDFLPFRGGIDAGAHSVLVAHNIVTCMDSQLPASLSPEVHKILREKLGFNGVVITDDLDMDAVKEHVTDIQPAVLAVLAGNDMLIVTDYAGSYQSILSAVKDGTISKECIDQGAFRVLQWKCALGLI